MTSEPDDTATLVPPRTDEHLFEKNGRTAVLRYTPEDSMWNVFTPDGVFVASLTRSEADGRAWFTLEGHRTGPVADELIVTDPDWTALVLSALDAADHFEP